MNHMGMMTNHTSLVALKVELKEAMMVVCWVVNLVDLTVGSMDETVLRKVVEKAGSWVVC